METVRDALMQRLQTLAMEVSGISVNTDNYCDGYVTVHLKEIFAGLDRAQEALDALKEPKQVMESRAKEVKRNVDTYARYLILKSHIFCDDSMSAPS